MKYRDLIRTMESHGWYSIRSAAVIIIMSIRRKHYEHPAKVGKVTIAGKPGQDVPPGTLTAILRQAGLK